MNVQLYVCSSLLLLLCHLLWWSVQLLYVTWISVYFCLCHHRKILIASVAVHSIIFSTHSTSDDRHTEIHCVKIPCNWMITWCAMQHTRLDTQHWLERYVNSVLKAWSPKSKSLNCVKCETLVPLQNTTSLVMCVQTFSWQLTWPLRPFHFLKTTTI